MGSPVKIIRRLLALEPVAVANVVRSFFLLLAAAGLVVPEEISTAVLATIAATYALIEVATAAWARARVTPDAKVVQVVDSSGVTVAGPASPLPDGTPVEQALTSTERLSLAQLHDALEEGDPGRDALERVLPPRPVDDRLSYSSGGPVVISRRTAHELATDDTDD